ncbi:hypothetical protein EBS67_14440 [bacterium]|nr:hypothetical protein [bacterium]
MFNLNGKKFKAGLAIAAFLGSTFSVLAEVEPLIMPAPLEPVPVEQIKAPVEQVKLKDTETKDGKPFVLPIPADLLKNKSKATDDPVPPPIAPPTSIIPGDKDNVLKNSIAIPVSEIKTVESGVASGSIEAKEATSEYLESERNGKSYRLEGLFMTGEYLLVKPRRDAFDFAITSSDRLGVINGNLNSLDWDTRSAFRVGIGYQFADGWDASVNYFYLHSSASSSLSAPNGGALYATLTNNTFDDVSTASAMGNLDMNVIDIDVARTYRAADNLNFRFTGGGRVTWIEQQFSAIYNGGTLGAVNDFVSSPVNFTGAGLTAGGEGTYALNKHFGLYARGKVALLSGTFNNNLTETNGNGATTFYNISNKYHEIVPVLETGVGAVLTKDHMHFKVGYELYNYFNMVDSLDFQSLSFGKASKRLSDLSLEALSIQFGLTF